MPKYAICPGCDQVRATKEIPSGTGDVRRMRYHRCEDTSGQGEQFADIEIWWDTKDAAEIAKATRDAKENHDE